MIYELFSHWIFLWFLFYYFNIVPYNPLFPLIIAYIIILIVSYYIFLEGASIKNITYFLIYNSIIKLVPIVLIIKTPVILYLKDVLFGLFLMGIYMIYMIINNKNPFDYYKEMIEIFKDKDVNIKTFTNVLIEDLKKI